MFFFFLFSFLSAVTIESNPTSQSEEFLNDRDDISSLSRFDQIRKDMVLSMENRRTARVKKHLDDMVRCFFFSSIQFQHFLLFRDESNKLNNIIFMRRQAIKNRIHSGKEKNSFFSSIFVFLVWVLFYVFPMDNITFEQKNKRKQKFKSVCRHTLSEIFFL